MNNLKVRINVGFRPDQQYTIDAEEAHKAYYLFFHPEERGVFNNGVAVIGRDIKSIEPDYHSTMGWNITHVLDNDDHNDLNSRGIDRKLRDVLTSAQKVGRLELTDDQRALPLSKLLILLPEKSKEVTDGVKALAQKFSI